jgi:DNA processing protein
MTPILSPNAQSILLLTAPLIAGRGGGSSADLLTPGEYKRLARHLRQIQRQPSDLIAPGAADVVRECRDVVDESRMVRLLGRGFLLSQVVERWQARAIWVISRADGEYPKRLKTRLREDAPPVLYGCGDIRILDSGGLAIVGSRHVDDSLIDYSMAIARLAARAGRTVVSGGAKGIDLAAMRGALESSGKVSGVLSDSLERAAMNREHRNLLLEGRLVLISPYDPGAGFNVGNAMQRNKVIYALADASLVVNADIHKGGTWAGAVEQLEKFRFVPVYVRSTGEGSAALDALQKKGALPWPNPQEVDSFDAVLDVTPRSAMPPEQVGFSLSNGESPQTARTVPQTEDESQLQSDAEPIGHEDTQPHEDSSSLEKDDSPENHEADELREVAAKPAEILFSAAREAIPRVLSRPMNDSEVAEALGLTRVQAKAWLQRLVDEGVLEKKKASAYSVKQRRLFE